uniref:rho GTPase-activating protein gacV-like isoform X2 n=1 Tax=Oncorhynchus gorbuscha TaxID=8017 RepID=UPI001EAEE7D3|nr:rho GTPase-activating protein gacV-like isoform X2 [Oncorhynchus gorbuscha]
MPHSSSLKLNHVPAEEEAVCCMEKETLVKEVEEEETVTIQKQVEVEAVTVNEEENDVSVKEEEDDDVSVKEDDEEDEEEGEVTVSSNNEEEEETGYLGPVSQTHLKVSDGSNDEPALINTRERCDYRGSSGGLNNLMMLTGQRIVSPHQNTSRNTSRDPQGRNLIAALTVGKVANLHQNLKYTREHTQERNLIAVINVGGLLLHLAF